jgi:DNA-binding transcriptional LysR family regulator
MNPNTFDLNLLRVFEALMRDRSVSLAANKLGLSQPAVSNALARMREFVGDQLFVKTRSGMEPTALASELRGPLEHSLATILTALSSKSTFEPAKAAMTFTIIMIDIGEVTLLPSLLSNLATNAPAVNLKILDVDRRNYEDYLDNGIADMAIGGVMLSDSFRSLLLFESSQVALLDRRNSLLAWRADGSPYLSRKAYFKARHVAIVPRGTAASRFEIGLGKYGDQREIALAIPHAAVLPAILPGTELVATVPKVTANEVCKDPRMCSVALPYPVEVQAVSLWWHKRHDQDRSHIWFRNLVASTCRAKVVDRPLVHIGDDATEIAR